MHIDTTVRSNSRTAILAEHLIKKLSGDKLCETAFPVVDEAIDRYFIS